MPRDADMPGPPFDRRTVRTVYTRPLPDLIYEAQTVHRRCHDPLEIQLCTLSNLKSGGCSEDCGYCGQSAHHTSGTESGAMPDLDTVMDEARRAKAAGATRLCMGAAWRSPRNRAQFERVLEMVGGVASLGMEVCCTLGMLSAKQALALKDAGLTVYNHNLDTSPEYYPRVVSTHTYRDRIETISRVREAGLQICCGGIIGMGEGRDDRIALLAELANLDPQPESVPINTLVPIEGTPLADSTPIDPIELVRTIATARCLMPKSRVRLAAGRLEMSVELQSLAFLAGANSIFVGERLLMTANPDRDADVRLLASLGLRPGGVGAPQPGS